MILDRLINIFIFVYTVYAVISCFRKDGRWPVSQCTCQQKLDTKIKKLDVEKYLAYNSNESLYKRSATP